MSISVIQKVQIVTNVGNGLEKPCPKCILCDCIKYNFVRTGTFWCNRGAEKDMRWIKSRLMVENLFREGVFIWL